MISCNLSNSKCILESFFATDVINSLQANIILMPQIEHNEIQPSSRPPPERVKYLHEENCKKNSAKYKLQTALYFDDEKFSQIYT